MVFDIRDNNWKLAWIEDSLLRRTGGLGFAPAAETYKTRKYILTRSLENCEKWSSSSGKKLMRRLKKSN
jgi:hypothetical protein